MSTQGWEAEMKSIRQQLLLKKKECDHFRELYYKERKERKFLQGQAAKLDEANETLNVDLNYLQNEIKKLKKKNASRTQCPWNSIRSARTKRRRMLKYRSQMFKALRAIVPDFNRAQVHLCVGGTSLIFKWSRNQCKPQQHQDKSETDHSYSSQETPPDQSDPSDTAALSSIFDDNGGYIGAHKRKIVHVMDWFQISHEAYHELYMHSKGYLPPLGQLLKEKKCMSQCIPYHKHSQVCTCLKNWFLSKTLTKFGS